MIIDDDTGTRETLSDIFQENGYTVATTGTGREAIDRAKETTFDAALIDIGLPDMNGVALLKEFKEACPEMVCCIITGSASLQNAIEALKDGASGYFVKPVVLEEVTRLVEDALDKQRLQRELRESEKRYRSLFDDALDMIHIVDRNGRIFNANKTELETMGYTKEEYVGKPLLEVIHPDYQTVTKKVFEQVIKGEEIKAHETALVTKKGEKVLVEINAVPRREGGEIVAVRAIIRDVTERKRAEKELKKYAEELEEANRLKDLFTDIMVHDLLGPAGAIRNATELILGEARGNEKKLLDIIDWGAKKQIGMIKSASKLSMLKSAEELEKQNLDLNEVIGRAVEDTGHLFEEADMQTENKVTNPMPLKANPLIEDIFYNLLSNAAKYAADGEKVVIEALDGEEGYTVAVKDYGPGISDKDKVGIFERFMRKEKRGVKGSGLGLTIAKRIVDLHSGKVWVEDNPEGGSIFYVTLPKEAAQ